MSLVVFFLKELFVMRGVDFFFVFRFFDVCVAPNLYGDIISYVISFFSTPFEDSLDNWRILVMVRLLSSARLVLSHLLMPVTTLSWASRKPYLLFPFWHDLAAG